MKILLTLLTSIFAFTAFAQGPVLRTPYTVNTATVVTNIVREIGTNSVIHPEKLRPGGFVTNLNQIVTGASGITVTGGSYGITNSSATTMMVVESGSAAPYFPNGIIGDIDASSIVGTIPDAAFPAILPAVDGSQLTGISGSGISPTGTVALSSIPLSTSATTYRATAFPFHLANGRMVNQGRLNIIILGNSISWESADGNWPSAMTNTPAFRGTKAVLNLALPGLGYNAEIPGAWTTNGLPWITNNVAADDVNLVLYAGGAQ